MGNSFFRTLGEVDGAMDDLQATQRGGMFMEGYSQILPSDWLVSKFSLYLMRLSLSSHENRTSEDDSKPKIHSMNFLNRLAIK